MTKGQQMMKKDVHFCNSGITFSSLTLKQETWKCTELYSVPKEGKAMVKKRRYNYVFNAENWYKSDQTATFTMATWYTTFRRLQILEISLALLITYYIHNYCLLKFTGDVGTTISMPLKLWLDSLPFFLSKIVCSKWKALRGIASIPFFFKKKDGMTREIKDMSSHVEKTRSQWFKLTDWRNDVRSLEIIEDDFFSIWNMFEFSSLQCKNGCYILALVYKIEHFRELSHGFFFLSGGIIKPSSFIFWSIKQIMLKKRREKTS